MGYQPSGLGTPITMARLTRPEEPFEEEYSAEPGDSSVGRDARDAGRRVSQDDLRRAIRELKATLFYVKPAVGFTLPSAGVTPAPSDKKSRNVEDDLGGLSADGVADCVEDIDEVAGGADFAEQRHPGVTGAEHWFSLTRTPMICRCRKVSFCWSHSSV